MNADRPDLATGSPRRWISGGGRLRGHFAAPLYRNAYFLIISAGVGSVLGFVFWSVAAHQYETYVVGVNSAVISAMILVSGVSQLGLNAVIVRYLPRVGNSTRRFVFAAYAVTGGLTALLALVAALTSARWSPTLRVLADDPRWLLTFVVATTAWTIFALQDSIITALRQTHWIPVENAMSAGAKIVLLIGIASIAPRGGIFVAWSVPVILSLLPINWLILRRLIPRHVKENHGVAWDGRRFFTLAAGNYAGSLFFLASTALLPILITNEIGPQATAYFYISWMLATTLQLVALNMTTSLTVEVAFDESKLREDCRRVIRQTLRLIVPAALLLIGAAPYVLQVFGASYASEGAALLRIIGAATIPNMIVVLGLSVARIQHDGRMVLVIQGAVCALTLALSVALLPAMGIEGVGLAILVSQTAVAVWLTGGKLRPLLFARAEPAHAPSLSGGRSKGR